MKEGDDAANKGWDGRDFKMVCDTASRGGTALEQRNNGKHDMALPMGR